MYIKPKSENSPPAKGVWYLVNNNFTWLRKLIGVKGMYIKKKSELSPSV